MMLPLAFSSQDEENTDTPICTDKHDIYFQHVGNCAFLKLHTRKEHTKAPAACICLIQFLELKHTAMNFLKAAVFKSNETEIG